MVVRIPLGKRGTQKLRTTCGVLNRVAGDDVSIRRRDSIRSEASEVARGARNVRVFEEPLLGSSVNFDLTKTDGCFNAKQFINKVQLEVSVTWMRVSEWPMDFSFGEVEYHVGFGLTCILTAVLVFFDICECRLASPRDVSRCSLDTIDRRSPRRNGSGRKAREDPGKDHDHNLT